MRDWADILKLTMEVLPGLALVFVPLSLVVHVLAVPFSARSRADFRLHPLAHLAWLGVALFCARLFVPVPGWEAGSAGVWVTGILLCLPAWIMCMATCVRPARVSIATTATLALSILWLVFCRIALARSLGPTYHTVWWTGSLIVLGTAAAWWLHQRRTIARSQTPELLGKTMANHPRGGTFGLVLVQFAIVAVIVPIWYYFAFEHFPLGTANPSALVAGVPFGDLAGEYYLGDGLGLNRTLKLTRDGRFFYRSRSCTGDGPAIKGYVDLQSRAIILRPKHTGGVLDLGGERGLVPVRWGQRMYLVPEVRMIDFCLDVNRGHEPRMNRRGFFYLRQGDWGKAAVGAPVVGARWRGHLLGHPVTGTITKVVDGQTARIDAGSEDGLCSGMILTVHGDKGGGSCELRVVTVGPHSGLAKKSRGCDSVSLAEGQAVSSLFPRE